MSKYRMPTWYWGKFVTLSEIKKYGWSLVDFEPYNEAAHGWHHSEEHKKENACTVKNVAKKSTGPRFAPIVAK